MKMMPAEGTSPHRRSGYRALTVLALVATTAAAVLSTSNRPDFARYFGGLHPVVATVIVLGAGALALRILEQVASYRVWQDGRGGRVLLVGLGAVLALPTIAVDLSGGFAEAINVSAPSSLLFYPMMALVAECVFHLVPLAIFSFIIFVVRRPRPAAVGDRALAAVSLLVALIEPGLQVLWGSESSPRWANTFVGMHVFAFNVVGLWCFRRYDFFTMYAFRIAYYLVWHVAWGALRLGMLFGG